MPKVSIIIPNYNHEVHLLERLNSVYNQTFQDFEVILLDDASTDGSLVPLEKYRNHPKTSHFIINKNNSGSPFKQWKKGLDLARGEYIWIAESDDSCKLDFLEKQILCIHKHKADVSVARTLKKSINGIGGELCHPIFKKSDLQKLNLDFFLNCPILNVSSILFKNKLVYENQEFQKYKLIGDCVFYFEAFHDKRICLNKETDSFCWQSEDSVSALAQKDIKYLFQYYIEHQCFAYESLKQRKINQSMYQQYVIRFFNRVKNRLSRKKKMSFTYLRLFLKFQKDLKIKT